MSNRSRCSNRYSTQNNSSLLSSSSRHTTELVYIFRHSTIQRLCRWVRLIECAVQWISLYNTLGLEMCVEGTVVAVFEVPP